ncbi:YggT family protein [Helicobacter sp. MIT 14-3879]|uniref:YggT family protein n=1 Tax=Helicobacter sp. MIT 14-3879 TaxID=2040649 RepID=UPI000E1E2F67|nr:YggT family protein [Helicobacter sp. MIT 14-3879]RDU65418.1 hypothetical protein CQA44_00035 [Helicobacter sp. MIT 14-3879]
MIFTTFLEAIATILHYLISIYIWVIIVSALLNLVQANPYNVIVDFLYRITEPLYIQVRKIIPTAFGGIDIAPFVIIVLLKFIDLFFVRVLFNYANL